MIDCACFNHTKVFIAIEIISVSCEQSLMFDVHMFALQALHLQAYLNQREAIIYCFIEIERESIIHFQTNREKKILSLQVFDA